MAEPGFMTLETAALAALVFVVPAGIAAMISMWRELARARECERATSDRYAGDLRRAIDVMEDQAELLREQTKLQGALQETLRRLGPPEGRKWPSELA